MKIRKKYQGVVPSNKVLNIESTSQTDTYSCDYINNMSFPGGGGSNIDDLPIGSVIQYDGEDIPEGWSEVDNSNRITNGDAIKAGYKIDGKDVYVKRVLVSSMPNNTTIEVDSGISSEYDIDYFTGVFVNNNKYTMPLPMEGTNFIRAGLDGRLSNYMIQISSNSDRTSWKGTFNIFYY